MMTKLTRALLVLGAVAMASLMATIAWGQSFSGTVQNHAIPIGKGPGVSGMTSLPPGATGTLLRSNGASADPSYANVTLILDSFCTARGSLLFRNATVWVCLPPGIAGQPLLTQGAGADPLYGTLAVPAGGTGLTSGTSGGVVAFTGPTTISVSSALTQNALVLGGGAGSPPGTPVSLGTASQLLHGNASGPPSWSGLDLGGDTIIGILSVTNGGTGLNTASQGDLLYGSTIAGWDRLSKNTSATRYLSNTGTSNGPAWSQVALTTGVSGVLPEANGGTNQSTYTQGDLLYASATDTLAKLAKDTNATRYLANTGTANAPQWNQVALTTGVSDYVEGSWTPTLIGSSTAGAQTYTVQVGRYVRIGNSVNVHARVTISAKDGAIAGNALVGGLPFTSRNVTNLFPSCSFGQIQNVTLSAGYFQFLAFVINNTTTIAMTQTRDNNTSLQIPVASLGATTDIIISCNYLIN